MRTSDLAVEGEEWAAIWMLHEVADPSDFVRRMTRGFREDLAVQALRLRASDEEGVTVMMVVEADDGCEALSVVAKTLSTLISSGGLTTRSLATATVFPLGPALS